MFTVPDNFLVGRLESLERFNTKQEKEALLVSDDDNLFVLLSKLTSCIAINELEANMFLLKLREISVGEDIEFIKTCDKCNTMNNPKIIIEDCFNFQDYFFKGHKVPKGLFTSLESIINIEDLDELSISEYKELEDVVVQQSTSTLKLNHYIPCRRCNNELEIIINPRFVFTKSSLANIYQEYVKISMFSNNGKLDIDSLYPFEREMYQNIIEDQMTEKGN